MSRSPLSAASVPSGAGLRRHHRALQRVDEVAAADSSARKKVVFQTLEICNGKTNDHLIASIEFTARHEGNKLCRRMDSCSATDS